jgi:hypothetical protein
VDRHQVSPTQRVALSINDVSFVEKAGPVKDLVVRDVALAIRDRLTDLHSYIHRPAFSGFQKLDGRLSGIESRVLEFKEWGPSRFEKSPAKDPRPSIMAKYFVNLANSDGGLFCGGVTADSTVKGVLIESEKSWDLFAGQFSQALEDLVLPSVPFAALLRLSLQPVFAQSEIDSGAHWRILADVAANHLRAYRNEDSTPQVVFS